MLQRTGPSRSGCNPRAPCAGSLRFCRWTDRPLPVRVMPLLGAAFLIVFDVALATGLRGVITRNEVDDLTWLGTPSALAITIMLSSIAFALATVASLYVLYRERTAAMNRVVYWHSLAVTGGPSRCGNLLRILGIDWRASMGAIEFNSET